VGSFTIRVYGICIYQGKVLVVDEFIKGEHVTKFPGGGLEFGEGTRECLKRELKEETGQDVEVLDHFYTTDFFQISKYNSEKQVLSIYYTFRFKEPLPELKGGMTSATESIESFRWIPIAELKKEIVSLPIDQLVVEMILNANG
jgi:ADP-ribose pyrophosphatase YjhB (NUDIX family)